MQSQRRKGTSVKKQGKPVKHRLSSSIHDDSLDIEELLNGESSLACLSSETRNKSTLHDHKNKKLMEPLEYNSFGNSSKESDDLIDRRVSVNQFLAVNFLKAKTEIGDRNKKQSSKKFIEKFLYSCKEQGNDYDEEIGFNEYMKYKSINNHHDDQMNDQKIPEKGERPRKATIIRMDKINLDDIIEETEGV